MSHASAPASGTHAEVTKHADPAVHHTKSFKTDRRDKAKHSGKSGAIGGAKKGGAGRGNWGRPGEEAKGEDELDKDDPNYVDDDDAAEYVRTPGYDWAPSDATEIRFASSLDDFTAFKAHVKSAAKEFINSNSAEEFIRGVKALSMVVFHQDIAYILIRYSLDRNDQERTRISSLLLSLHKNGMVTPAQMGASLRKAYSALPEMTVDCPNAKTLLREYVQFAVAGGFCDSHLAQTLEAEQAALADTTKVNEVKAKIKTIVSEFFRSEDLPDALKSLTELNAPFLAFETVKQLISVSLDQASRQREGVSVFLADSNGYLQPTDIEKGFTTILERVDDLVLDCPDVLKLLSVFVARAVVDEAIAPAFLVRVDLHGNDLGSRVLQQAQELLAQEQASDRLLYVWEDLADEESARKAKLNPPTQ